MPAPPVQLPPETGVAARVTAVVPHVILSAPAFAVTGILTVTVIVSVASLQGPAPSGSGTSQISVMVVPISPAAGVYVALAVVLLGVNVPAPPVQFPPSVAFAFKEIFEAFLVNEPRFKETRYNREFKYSGQIEKKYLIEFLKYKIIVNYENDIIPQEYSKEYFDILRILPMKKYTGN